MAYDEELAYRIRALLATECGLDEKRMFGGLAFLINGNMAVAASGKGGIMVRVAPEETESLLEYPHTRPMVMSERELRGWLRVDDAGIATVSGLLADEARELNRGFLSRIERGRPFVRIKTAASLDGKTALSDGRSQWITDSAARADVQILRAESCAVLTGIGTVLADDPQLNVRDFPTLRQPLRIVLDSRLRLSPAHRIAGDGGATLVITLVPDDGRFAVCPAVRVRTLPDDGSGRIHLAALLELLAAEEQIGELMVEAGATLAGEFLRQDLADEIVHYQAPKILGSDARNLFRLPENPAALSGSGIWHSRSVEMLGSDIKWTLRRA